MHINRILAVVYRYFLQLRDANRLLEMTLWPAVDAFLGGIISSWMVRDTSMTHAAYIPLFGIFFWQIVTRTYTDMGAYALEEIWNKNLSNLFSTPLYVSEWLTALMVFATLRAVWVGVLCSFIIAFVFNVSITIFGWWLLALTALLILTGLAFGILGAALAVTWGNRVMALIFSFWLLIPFCGTLYPIDILPVWIQYLSTIIPLTHIFGAIQQFIMTGSMPVAQLYCALALSSAYLLGGIVLCNHLIAYSKNLGLARLEAE